MINKLDIVLYILNIILVVFGILFMVYSINYLTVKDYYCDNLYFLSIMIIINSFLCIFTLKKYKIIGFITTLLLFIYNIYNIIVIPCNLKLYLINCYISFIIFNGLALLVYILYYCNKQKLNRNDINLDLV